MHSNSFPMVKQEERRVALNAYRDDNVSYQNGSVISEAQKKLTVT